MEEISQRLPRSVFEHDEGLLAIVRDRRIADRGNGADHDLPAVANERFDASVERARLHGGGGGARGCGYAAWRCCATSSAARCHGNN